MNPPRTIVHLDAEGMEAALHILNVPADGDELHAWESVPDQPMGAHRAGLDRADHTLVKVAKEVVDRGAAHRHVVAHALAAVRQILRQPCRAATGKSEDDERPHDLRFPI